nr:hypothetical protein CFP56_47285 [Quercus suber]
MSSHHDEFMREVDTTGVGGSHTKESLAPLEKASTVRNQSLKMAMSSTGQTEMTGRPAKAPVTSVEAKCLIFNGSRVNEPSITLGKAETKDDKALIGLVLSNYVLSPSRFGTEKLGV